MNAPRRLSALGAQRLFLTLALTLGVGVSARAETVETGDNWRRDTLDVHDLVKFYGAQTALGWGLKAAPYIQLACFVSSPGRTFIGPGTLSVALDYFATSFVDVESGQARPTYGLGAVVVSYTDAGGHEQVATPIEAFQLTDLPHWVYVSSDGQNGSVFYASSETVSRKSVLRSFHFDGKAVGVQVSVCNVMPRTEMTIAGVVLDFTKDQ